MRKPLRLRLGAVLLVALSVGAGQALGHHSPIIFDRTRTITIEGVVTEFKWSSPHSWIHLDVKDENGAVGNWGIEMNPASTLARAGWKSTTIKPGDKVSIVVYPLRNNEKGGQYVSIKLPDGKTLGERPDGVL
jgi:hypothetical protein